MKKIFLAFALTVAFTGTSFATLTANKIPVTKIGGTTPTLQDSPISISGSNVGIGTSSPINVLDVKVATNQHFVVWTNGVVSLVGVNDSGNTLVEAHIDANPLVLNSTSSGDIYTNAWSDYSASSTIVGWSSFTTKIITVGRLGKRVYVNYYLAGPSNSATSSFTLAYPSMGTWNIPGQMSSDNGGSNVPSMALTNNSYTVILYKDMNAGAWTSSGTKIASGQFWYQSL
jgi:hypothetical protein